MKLVHLVYLTPSIVFNYMTKPQLISPLSYYLYIACNLFYYEKSGTLFSISFLVNINQNSYVSMCIDRERQKDRDRQRDRKGIIWRERFLK